MNQRRKHSGWHPHPTAEGDKLPDRGKASRNPFDAEDFVNKPPVVTLIEPQDGVQITWPGPTMFRAEAHDPDGEVERVRFRLQQKRDDGTRTMGFGRSEGINGWEVEFDWQRNPEIPQGNWTVWAEATDNEGQMSVSPEIVITLYRP